MKVCIAEKPSVAKEIAQILGASQRKDGYFEGNNYQVTWTFGHLCSLKEPHDYLPEWKRWDLTTLPIIPSPFGIKLLNDQGVIKQFKVIESLVNSAELVINCGDAGQEGEVIQRWVLQKAGCTCPVKRLWISSLTEEAIREGFEKLYDGSDFDLLYAAGSSRSIGDWLLGINATRLYTLKYSRPGQVLSIGRVQTPTLALIVERQKEIDQFIPQAYWELKTMYKEVSFSATEGKFFDKEAAYKAIESIRGQDFEITDFGRKKGSEAAPRLFDLTSLQVECNRKFGLSADETLKTIQSLYEKKLTSYPRVDTTYLSNDLYPKIPAILKGLKPYEALIAPILEKKIPKSKKVFDDTKVTDHHAIIPTGQNPATSGLSRDEKLVFDLVTRRFIAAFYPDSIINTTTVEGKVQDVKFKTTGKQILEEGWRVVFKTETQIKNEDNILPEFTKGERGPHDPDLQEKETQPPKPYTEATLLRAMETAGKQIEDEELREAMKENGIGRPSTRAAIIETLFKRKYIVKNKKNLVPTITGTQLIDTIHTGLLKSAELTGMWEKKLREIEHNKYDAGAFMAELKQMVSDIVHTVKHDQFARKIEMVVEESIPEGKASKTGSTVNAASCPRCGQGKMLKGKKAWGCSRYADGCNTLVPFVFMGKMLTDGQADALFRKGKTVIIKGFDLDGAKVDGSVFLDEQYRLCLERAEQPILRCPRCKEGLILKGRSAWGCERFHQGCRLIVPFEFMGKKITEKQMEDLILKGKSGKIKGFQDGAGPEKSGKLTWDADFKLRLEEE